MKKTLPEKLRICFLSQKLPRFAAAADYGYLWPLCRNLATRGHDVTVITVEATTGSLTETSHGVQIHHVEQPAFGEIGASLRESVLDRFEQLHLEKPFDIVHSVDGTGYLVALHKKELDVVFAADINGLQLDHIFGILGLTEEKVLSYLQTSVAVASKFLRSFFGNDRKLLKNSDGVFVTSKQQRNILELYYFVPDRRIYVIPYGINSKELEPEAPTENPFSELGIEPDTKVILTVTPLINVEETKNLLTAFERVVIKKPKIALVIVGEGPKRKELEFHMLSLALASKVWFTGSLSPEKVDSLITACDIYVNLHSKSSGFEPTVLEAMACGKMVIGSEVGTSSNVIQNGIDGFLLRPTEISALSRLLLDGVSGQIDTLAVGHRARQKILKMFDTTRMVEETIRAYFGILKSTGKYKK